MAIYGDRSTFFFAGTVAHLFRGSIGTSLAASSGAGAVGGLSTDTDRFERATVGVSDAGARGGSAGPFSRLLIKAR